MHPRRLAATALCALAAPLAAAGPAQAAEYVDGQVIVKWEDGAPASERAALLRRAGAVRTLGSIRGIGSQVVRVTGSETAAAARLERSPLVEYAEPNYLLRARATPDDPLFGDLYGLHNTGQTGGTADADVDAPEGWDLAGMASFPSSGGVKVGIVDTGIDQAHPDLAGKVAACAESRGLLGLLSGSIREGRCADDNGHGTHVAGTISANANNGQGVAGLAFDSPLVICRALGGVLGTGSTADVANCIDWTHQKGARVISMSLGGGDSNTLRDAVRRVWRNGGSDGSVLVAAAGNDGNSTVNYPAGYAEVVSVAATDHRDRRASFSNANADVEVAAPGVDVLSTYLGGGYTELSGTSMATPHASAVAAVLWRLHPTDTASGIRSRLGAAVDDLGPAGRDPEFGFGRVNLCTAAGGGCAYTAGG